MKPPRRPRPSPPGPTARERAQAAAARMLGQTGPRRNPAGGTAGTAPDPDAANVASDLEHDFLLTDPD